MQIEIPNEQFLELNGLKVSILKEFMKYNKHIEIKYLLPLVHRCYTMMLQSPSNNALSVDVAYAVGYFISENHLRGPLTKSDYHDLVQVLKAGM